MKQRGIKASPVTVGLCEKNATICWGHGWSNWLVCGLDIIILYLL